MLRNKMAGMVVEIPEASSNPFFLIFEDDTHQEFYSSQEISESSYIDLAGMDALQKCRFDVNVWYEA